MRSLSSDTLNFHEAEIIVQLFLLGSGAVHNQNWRVERSESSGSDGIIKLLRTHDSLTAGHMTCTVTS